MSVRKSFAVIGAMTMVIFSFGEVLDFDIASPDTKPITTQESNSSKDVDAYPVPLPTDTLPDTETDYPLGEEDMELLPSEPSVVDTNPAVPPTIEVRQEPSLEVPKDENFAGEVNPVEENTVEFFPPK